MRSVVASRGPGSNPRGSKILKFQNRPKRARYGISARKLHGLPGTGLNQTLEEFSRHDIAGASPEWRPAGGAATTKNSQRQRATPHQARRTAARNSAPSDHRAPRKPRPVAAASEKCAASALPRRATMRGQRSRSKRYTAQHRTTGGDTPSAIMRWTGQRSRAMRGQREGVARARARCEDDEEPPCAAAPWPV
ncbi:ankyrin-3 [Dorcoceras hygrometricum]|uniref:Ankyrin-3 n=1 Tax=Dorcoceras hygrometricum TaxID=472368 RepID=A0A2Z7AS14_9LAMI|nr:ankyrin-3 [Dorcoceras hygrometricum]